MTLESIDASNGCRPSERTSNLDKKRHLLEAEIQRLKARIGTEPEAVLELAQQYVDHSLRLRFPEGSILSLMIMARCAWCLMDYRNGLKYIKRANSELNSLDTDDYRSEILHIHALHYWGKQSTIQLKNIGSVP